MKYGEFMTTKRVDTATGRLQESRIKMLGGAWEIIVSAFDWSKIGVGRRHLTSCSSFPSTMPLIIITLYTYEMLTPLR
jgi:hypothetical protein